MDYYGYYIYILNLYTYSYELYRIKVVINYLSKKN